MSEAIDLGEIAARVEAQDTVSVEEFVATISDMNRAMVRSGHFAGAASTFALVALAGASATGASGKDLLLDVLADTAQFVKDNR